MKKIMRFCFSMFAFINVIGCSNTEVKHVHEPAVIKSENVDASKLSEDDQRRVQALEENGFVIDYVKDGNGGYKATIKDDDMMIYVNGYRGIENDVYIMHFKTYHDFETNFIAQELEEGFEYLYLKNAEDGKFYGYPMDTRKLSEEDAAATKAITAPYNEFFENRKREFKQFRENIGIEDFNELADFIENLTIAYDGKKEESMEKKKEEEIGRRCGDNSSGSYFMMDDGDLIQCP